MPNNLQGEQGVDTPPVKDEALSALSSLDEDDQLKVIDYIKTLVHVTKGVTNESR